MIHVIGIDPGHYAGWGLIRTQPSLSQLLAFGRCGSKGKPTTGKDAYQVLEQCKQVLGMEHWPPTLAIEGQFLRDKAGRGQRDRGKATNTIKTARHMGGWIYIADRYGIPVFSRTGTVASIWRVAIFGNKARWWSNERAKAEAVEYVNHVFEAGLPKTRHDIAEGVLIGLYAAQRIKDGD